MRNLTQAHNENGYFTAQQIIERHPLVIELFGWTPHDLNQIAKWELVRARIYAKSVYIHKGDLMELAAFLCKRDAERKKEAMT